MTSLRKAINAYCKSCIYYPKSSLGGWRQQVEGCVCTECALYEVRLITLPKSDENEVYTAELCNFEESGQAFEIGVME